MQENILVEHVAVGLHDGDLVGLLKQHAVHIVAVAHGVVSGGDNDAYRMNIVVDDVAVNVYIAAAPTNTTGHFTKVALKAYNGGKINYYIVDYDFDQDRWVPRPFRLVASGLFAEEDDIFDYHTPWR